MAIETVTQMPSTAFPGGLSGYEGRRPVTETTTPATTDSAATTGTTVHTDTDGRKYKWAYDSTKGWYKEYVEEAPATEETPAQTAQQSGGSYKPEDTNPEWTKMTDAEKAAYYAENPRMAWVTRLGQDAFGYTGLGQALGWLQEKLNPGFASGQRLTAWGVDPSTIPVADRTATLKSFGDTYNNLRGLGYSLADAQRGAVSAVQSGYQPYGGSGLGGYTGVTYSDEPYSAPAGTTMTGSPDMPSSGGGGSYRSGDSDSEGGGFSGTSLGGFFSGSGTSGDKTGGRIGDKPHHKHAGMKQGLGSAGLETGGFVVPADVISKAGNGSTDAGFEKLSAALGGLRRIHGKGDGMSDSIPTKIDGKQPAAVAKDEGYLTPQQVKRLGGAKRLYAMLDNIRQQAHGTTKQQRPVNVKKALG